MDYLNIEDGSMGGNVKPQFIYGSRVMDIREKYSVRYSEIGKLVEELKDSNSYGPKYEVIKRTLEEVETIRSETERTDITDEDRTFCRVYQKFLFLAIGILYIDVEETSEGVNYLMKILDQREDPFYLETLYTSIEARNHLGYVWLQQSKPEEAKNCLEEAEKLYCDFKKAPKIFFPLKEETLERAHTMTKYYLAQTYEVLKDFLKSSIYCHETLKRQLALKDYDPVDWAMNSAILSQFFCDKMLFKQCRNHLAAANYVLDTYAADKLNNIEGSEEDVGKKEEFRKRSADLSYCWAKYGIKILQYSRHKLSGSEEEEEEEEEVAVKEKLEDLKSLCFDDLDVVRYEDQVTDEEVVTFEDARKVFLFSQRHFNKAKEYYTLEDRASKHTELVRDHSQLFGYLSHFDPDEERQFKMLKKQADMLEVVAEELNPSYYLDKCRQLWFDLGRLYHDMMQLRSQKIEGTQDPRVVHKFNSLIDLSIKNFNRFLDSIQEKNTKRFPDRIEEDLVNPTLNAHFYLGRLHFKHVTSDMRSEVENIKETLKHLKYLVDYCDNDEKAKALVGEKYKLSRSLVFLLQMRLLQL